MIVKDGRLALPGAADFARIDIRIEGERIVEIAPIILPRPGEELLDASPYLVLPGAIDPHVHFDEPGFTHREDFLHGTMEAARGGVTTVIDMPCTSLPPVTNIAALEGKLAAVSRSAVVDYGFFGGVPGNELEKCLGGAMAELAPKVLGFKCYFISGMESFARVTHEGFERVVAEADRLGRPVLLHAEDFDYVTAATARVKAARGDAAPEWSDYAASRPEAAELVACASALALARGRESVLHVVHVGTPAAAELLAAGGATCETCAHYLAFGDEDFAALGASLKTAPVVKSRNARDRLMTLLAEGKIAFVASDHAPAPASEKETGNPWTAYGGIPGTGTLLPYLLSEGLLAGRLSLPRFLEAVSSGAARRYGLWARKGSLEVGKDADFVLADPTATFRVEGRRLLSKGRITPFEGMPLHGSVVATYVRGRAVYDSRTSATSRNAHPEALGILAEPGSGRFLTWGYR